MSILLPCYNGIGDSPNAVILSEIQPVTERGRPARMAMFAGGTPALRTPPSPERRQLWMRPCHVFRICAYVDSIGTVPLFRSRSRDFAGTVHFRIVTAALFMIFAIQ